MTHYEIYLRIKKVLPAEALERYDHLCYGEMAEVPELAPWAEELRVAEEDWSRIWLERGGENFA
jgi:hypothetical protein